MPEKYTGFHSTIKEIKTNNNSSYLEKRYGQKALGFEMSLAFSIVKDMKRFSTIANEIGIPAVSPIGHVVYNNGHEGRVDLAEYVPQIGSNLMQIMEEKIQKSEIDSAMNYYRRYLAMFRMVWDAGFPISLDPPLTNFCVTKDNNIWYVDLMPPRQKREDGSYLSELPPPLSEDSEALLIDRYFTKSGQAQIIYAQSLRNLIPLGVPIEKIKGTICEILGETAGRAIDMNQDKILQIIQQPKQSDTDQIRIIAAEQYEKGNLEGMILKKIYEICHVGIGGIFPQQEDLQRAVNLLQTNSFI